MNSIAAMATIIAAIATIMPNPDRHESYIFAKKKIKIDMWSLLYTKMM
jgi:hypothetical protein